jgi:hypothetical protein
VVINSTDYFLYLPLMPQVAGGLLEPRHIRASLARRLRTMQFVLGTVNHVDARQKVVSWAGPEGASGQVGYDRLILTAGSVNKLLPIRASRTAPPVSGPSPKRLRHREKHEPPARATGSGRSDPRAGQEWKTCTRPAASTSAPRAGSGAGPVITACRFRGRASS